MVTQWWKAMLQPRTVLIIIARIVEFAVFIAIGSGLGWVFGHFQLFLRKWTGVAIPRPILWFIGLLIGLWLARISDKYVFRQR